MSIKALTDVWEYAPFDGGTLLVMLALADYADDEGFSYPAVATIAMKARLSERAVQYAIKHLTEAGWLVVKPNAGRHGSNLYQLVRGADIAPTPANVAPGGANDVSQIAPDPSDPDPDLIPSSLSDPSFFHSMNSASGSGSGAKSETGAEALRVYSLVASELGLHNVRQGWAEGWLEMCTPELIAFAIGKAKEKGARSTAYLDAMLSDPKFNVPTKPLRAGERASDRIVDPYAHLIHRTAE